MTTTITIKGSPTFRKSEKRYLPTPKTNRLAGSGGVINDSDAESVTMMTTGRALTPSISAVDIAIGSKTNAAAALDIGCVSNAAISNWTPNASKTEKTSRAVAATSRTEIAITERPNSHSDASVNF